MTVFVDTSAFLAFLNAGDQFHAAAVEQWQALLDDGEALLCNNYILIETTAILQHRFGLEAVRTFYDDLLPVVTVSWVDENIHHQATAALLTARRRQLSLVDCSAMATLRAHHLTRVFTFDAHFAEYGFVTLPG